MYHLRGNGPMGSGSKTPDWENLQNLRKSEYEIISEFKTSLIRFIKVIGPHSTHNKRDGGNPIAELLGTVEIDIIQRKAELKRIQNKIA